MQVSSGGVTVLKPDGQAQAVLGLPNGNSTIWVHPSSATSKGAFTISQASGPNIKVGKHHCDRRTTALGDMEKKPFKNTVATFQHHPHSLDSSMHLHQSQSQSRWERWCTFNQCC